MGGGTLLFAKETKQLEYGFRMEDDNNDEVGSGERNEAGHTLLQLAQLTVSSRPSWATQGDKEGVGVGGGRKRGREEGKESLKILFFYLLFVCLCVVPKTNEENK